MWKYLKSKPETSAQKTFTHKTKMAEPKPHQVPLTEISTYFLNTEYFDFSGVDVISPTYDLINV